MTNMGILKDQANYRYGLGVLLGGTIAPGDLGVALMTDISRIKYILNSYGKSAIKSKISFNLGSAFLGKNDIINLGVSYLGIPLNPRFNEEIKLMGLGVGVVNMSNIKENLSRTGGYISFIMERNHLYISQSFNIPFTKNPLVNWSIANLMVGYRF